VDENVNQEVNDNLKKFFVLSFICNITETIASLIDKSEFTVRYKFLNTLKKIVKVHKDKTEFNANNNVVYKICCKDCNAFYVEQTKRMLKNEAQGTR